MNLGMLNMNPMQMPMVLWQQMAQIAWESQVVITMRTAGLLGIVSQEATEPARMVTEKADAATEAMCAALRSAGRGERADQVMAAALRPYRRRTRENVRRLTSD